MNASGRQKRAGRVLPEDRAIQSAAVAALLTHVIAGFIGPDATDPTVFLDPHRFAPDRTPNLHLSFGRGVHACLGAHLARREATIAVRCLLEHVPGRWRVPGSELVATTTPVGTDIRRLVLTGC